MTDFLDQLQDVLLQRKTAAPDTSYVASLYAGGGDAILKKLGEETTELVLAAKSGDRQSVIHETADVWFHSLVLLSHLDIPCAEVIAELQRRCGRSGLEEKANRRG